MKISKKSKQIISTVAVISLTVLAAVGFFMYEGRKPYRENSIVDFAMGSPVAVKTFGNVRSGVEEEIIKSIKRLDTEILSNKTDSSVIGRINAGETVSVDEGTFSIIAESLGIYSKTEGKAALTVGALSGLWDFDSGKSCVPEKKEIENALIKTDDAKIRFKGIEQEVENDYKVSVRGGAKLDLGSVGKGAACDTAAKILDENGIENAVVAVGGSIYAKGCSAKNKKINIGIRNPFGNENDYFAVFSTDNAFVSTSGNYEKAFVENGKTYHHLLDCTTGYPVEGELVSVTVITDGGAKSDALSTACFVMGYGEKTLSLLKENNARAIFIFKDRTVIIGKSIEDAFSLTDSSFKVSSYED